MTSIPISAKSRCSLNHRFWSKVRKSEQCWEWVGAKYPSGYGALGVGSRSDGTRTLMAAHRISWILKHGDIPTKLWVLHHCDNKSCVRPDHLFLGDAFDNMRDMTNKGRNKCLVGAAHCSAKLTEKDVKEIRGKYSRKAANGKELAAEYGVSNVMIYRIVKFLNWKHI